MRSISKQNLYYHGLSFSTIMIPFSVLFFTAWKIVYFNIKEEL